MLTSSEFIIIPYADVFVGKTDEDDMDDVDCDGKDQPQDEGK